MGKVKDEAPAKSAKGSPKGSSLRKTGGRVVSFVANLASTQTFKPTQGKNARLWTGVGLGAIVATGLYQLHEQQLQGQYGPAVRLGIPTALGLAFGWMIWRLVQYPPFADFLIATEAEMNKVSWTSRDDLYRATIVVLVTVLFLSVYLFGVDFLWSTMLQAIGVLKFKSTSLGEQAG